MPAVLQFVARRWRVLVAVLLLAVLLVGGCSIRSLTRRLAVAERGREAAELQRDGEITALAASRREVADRVAELAFLTRKLPAGAEPTALLRLQTEAGRATRPQDGPDGPAATGAPPKGGRTQYGAANAATRPFPGPVADAVPGPVLPVQQNPLPVQQASDLAPMPCPGSCGLALPDLGQPGSKPAAAPSTPGGTDSADCALPVGARAVAKVDLLEATTQAGNRIYRGRVRVARLDPAPAGQVLDLPFTADGSRVLSADVETARPRWTVTARVGADTESRLWADATLTPHGRVGYTFGAARSFAGTDRGVEFKAGIAFTFGPGSGR